MSSGENVITGAFDLNSIRSLIFIFLTHFPDLTAEMGFWMHVAKPVTAKVTHISVLFRFTEPHKISVILEHLASEITLACSGNYAFEHAMQNQIF
jgi:hypothetical protein